MANFKYSLKLNRTYLFIIISSIALIVVLIIQVNWIIKTAKVKEALFNEKANIILARTTDALLSDKETCKKMEVCVGKNEIHKIDSLFKYYMKFYNFHITYTFEVKPKSVNDKIMQHQLLNQPGAIYPPSQPACYQKNLEEEVNKNGFVLKLIFPEKEEYIMEEMGTMFVTSVVLILIVLIMFWRNTISLMKEKEISEHTTDFLNNMTHEFKTPLTNISLAGRMIIKESTIKQEDKIKDYSGIILEENEKLRLQVEQVLSMTALERGEIPLHKIELDFHQLILDSVKSISIQIENKQGSLILNLNADKCIILGDKIHLSNAICNLIDNAIKYSNDKPDIGIETYNVDRNLIVVVSDKGIGINEKYHRKVFDKFFRVPTGDIHDVKGFGLGLSYIKKIVELHIGTIELKSNSENGKEGQGSSFIITLPNA